MNEIIQKGKAPRGIIRVDKGQIVGEQAHVHFENGAALNIDGTWTHGFAELTNSQKEWLNDYGWTLP